MIVAFDGTIFNTPKTGIAYYTQFLMRHLANEQAMGILAFDGLRMRNHKDAADDCASAKPASHSPPLAPLVDRLRQIGAVRAAWRSFKAIGFSRALKGADIFHATNYLPPARTDVPTLPLIHDLSHIRHPEWHPAERLRWLESRSAEFTAAPLVNTVSLFSGKEIQAVLGIPAERIHVTYPGINPVYSVTHTDASETLQAVQVRPGGFFLCVGTLEPRKNLVTAIGAYSRLPASFQDRFPILVVGPQGWGDLALPACAQQLERQGRLRFLGYMNEARMRDLYQECAAFLYPSSYEGFGMPVSEAMATGSRPVISADGAPEEVAGNLGVSLPAFNTEAWTLAMMQAVEEGWHADAKLRNRLRERSRRFDWTINARATRAIYEALLR